MAAVEGVYCSAPCSDWPGSRELQTGGRLAGRPLAAAAGRPLAAAAGRPRAAAGRPVASTAVAAGAAGAARPARLQSKGWIGGQGFNLSRLRDTGSK